MNATAASPSAAKEEAAVRLPRATKGRRPAFFNDPAIDQLMTFVVELATETSGIADRLDVFERVMAKNGVVRREDIENWRADDKAEAERNARRDAFIRRVFRLRYVDDQI